MTDGADATVEIVVTSFHPGTSGGGIVIGWPAGGATKPARARLAEDTMARSPKPGETWRITGRTIVDPDHGPQVVADVALPLMPSGTGIIRWIALNRRIPGVGERTAARLWDAFENDLYAHLRDGDAAALAAIVGPVAAADIISAFSGLREEITVLETYDRYGVDPRTAVASCALWGAEAVLKLESNPYVLNTVEPWRKVDGRGLRLGISPSDPRRLIAAVGETCSRRYSGRDRGLGGNLANTRAEIEFDVARLLTRPFAHLATAAVDLAIEAGELVAVGDLFQSRGCHLMERSIERLVADRLARRRENPDTVAIDAAIRTVEEDLGHVLEPAQRKAVHMAASSGFSVIDGGAGTGKTTVTLAIMRAVQSSKRPYLQMALSGRAAKRISEATSHEAMTIHRFLKGVVNGKLRVLEGLVVVDEASMVGTPDLWQILTWLPVEVDVVLIGDPGQLPPISPGRPFAAAVEGTTVPRTTLMRIHRQAGTSSIPFVAAEIRSGRLPELPDFEPGNPLAPGVFMLRVSEQGTATSAIHAFEALAGVPPTADRESLRRLHEAAVQVLGATIHGPSGVFTLSDQIEERWMRAQRPIADWGLSVGSKILWTRNVYDKPVSSELPNDTIDIMNGSLGVVQRHSAGGAVVMFDDVDASRAEILRGDLMMIRRGWAVTVHKAQGSAFTRVVMPIARSRLLDRLLIYTGLTRATTTVVLVGDEDLLRTAISASPRSWAGRQTLRL